MADLEEYQLSELTIVNWISEILDRSIHDKKPIDTMTPDDFLSELVMMCMDDAFAEVLTDHRINNAELEKDPMILLPIVKRFDGLWNYVVQHLKERYGMDVYRFYDFAIIMNLDIGESMQSVMKSMKTCSEYYMNQCITDKDIPTTYSPEEWRQKISEFMERFKDLGVYYHDVSQYKTEEERKKHEELTNLFYEIMSKQK